ncbi:MAG: tRNA lysidine(34) synthetase TilS [Crocinitomicaceae bacterium]|nr:tRNA lysidine(34) synthetase TilS [Crocinitomicaceae bacterium]
MINTFDFLEQWKAYQSKPIYLGCSGGVDSMVLFHLLRENNFKFTVLHVNYQLRGADSEGDEKWVKETCERFDIPFKVRKVDTPQLLQEGGNLQELTRKIRYAWFQELLDQNPDSLVALAHHQDDQIETFFQHIARKSGIIGMACMLYEHEHFIRPLLLHSKTEILAYAKENQVEWREDISNSQSKYTRNKLRNILIPEMEKSVPNLSEAVITLVKAFQQTQLFLESEAAETIQKIRTSNQWEFENFDITSEVIQVEILRQLGIRASILFELQKLRKTQKGRKISIDGMEIWKENSHFGIYPISDFVLPKLEITEVNELPNAFSKNTLYLDGNKIKGKLKLRKWEKGDQIQALGVNGSTLISKVLTGAQISSREKENALVLCDDESVLWCVGHKVSSLAIADEQSSLILEVRVD